MGLLLPIGAVLIAIGTAGSAAACFGNSVFDGKETETMAWSGRSMEAFGSQGKLTPPRGLA